MIQIKNINIMFSENIIIDGKLDVQDQKITVITGSSGSGKSSILYYLGLLTNDFKYKYFFDNEEINLNSDEKKAFFRKTHIGYIFQDNNLIDKLTIQENMKMQQKLSNDYEYEVDEVLGFVNIDISKKNFYPQQLSGGERQRVAIACALIKNPSLIIADEPTSALDESNSNQIIELLKKISHEKKTKIVIATHDSKMINIGDVVYKIENRKICKIKENNSEKIKLKDKKIKKNKLKLYLDYISETSKKEKIISKIMVLLCTISIALSATISSFGTKIIADQYQFLNTMSDKEIYLLNSNEKVAKTPGQNVSIEDLEKIKKISEIKKIYPMVQFESEKNGYGTFSEGNVVNSRTNDKMTNKFTVLPYYEFQKIDDLNEKVFISAELAKNLNIELGDKINMIVGIPINTENVEVSITKNDVEKKENMSIPVLESYEINFEVDGILDTNHTNKYTTSGYNNVYMPFSRMEKILNDMHSKFIPMSYSIEANSFEDVESIIKKIASINPNLKAVSELKDLNALKNNISQLKSGAQVIMTIVLVILLTMMSLIYTLYIEKRKFEFAILQANGFMKKEIIKLINLESLMFFIKTTISSTILCMIFVFIGNFVGGSTIFSININLVAILLFISLIATVPSFVVLKIVVSKSVPSKVLRN